MARAVKRPDTVCCPEAILASELLHRHRDDDDDKVRITTTITTIVTMIVTITPALRCVVHRWKTSWRH